MLGGQGWHLSCLTHLSLASGLADEPEPVAAAGSRPAALVVPDVPAEAHAPGQAVLLVTLPEPELGPAEGVHLSAPGPLPLPRPLHIDVIAADPVFAPPPPRLVADPVQEVLHLVLGLEADQPRPPALAALLSLDPADAPVAEVEAIILHLLKSTRTASWGD